MNINVTAIQNTKKDTHSRESSVSGLTLIVIVIIGLIVTVSFILSSFNSPNDVSHIVYNGSDLHRSQIDIETIVFAYMPFLIIPSSDVHINTFILFMYPFYHIITPNDALSVETQRLSPAGYTSGYQFGQSVAIDKHHIVVGQSDVSYIGSIYIYSQNSSNPLLYDKITKIEHSSSDPNEDFGYNVAISNNTIVAGAWRYGGYHQGSVVFYENINDTWEYKQEFTHGDASNNDAFGMSVAIYNDIAVVGAYGRNLYYGAAYVYTKDTYGIWSNTAYLTASDAEELARYATDVDIYNHTIVIGSHTFGAGDFGHAYIYEYDGNDWIEIAILEGREDGEWFGVSVSIDKEVIVIGAWFPYAASNIGSAYVYQYNGTDWQFTQKLSGDTSISNTRFGFDVVVKDDIILVGAYWDDDIGVDAGAVYIYQQYGVEWIFMEKIFGSVENKEFGHRFATDIDQDVIVIGAQLSQDTYDSPGSVSIFDFQRPPTTNPTTDPTYNPTLVPTLAPTAAPSFPPTFPPSAAPSSSPSSPPTAAPSLSPTFTPTTCYDIDGEMTADGEDQSVFEAISNAAFIHNVKNESNIVIAIERYHDTIDEMKNNHKQELHCTDATSCLGSTIVFENNDICNLVCSETVSCSSAYVSMINCIYGHIICHNALSCGGLQIEINSIGTNGSNGINIECLESESCKSLHVDVLGNNDVVDILCVNISACDDAEIFVSAENHQNVHLKMMSYSKNVAFSNEYGFEETDGSDVYIQCNTQQKYIAYDNSVDNITLETTESLVLNEFIQQIFPCNGVIVICSKTNNTVSSCYLEYDIREFNISSETQTNASIPCYWVPLEEVVDIWCTGNCVTASPTFLPSFSPTADTSNPTHDPTNEPTLNPTNNPTFEPSLQPSGSPTLTPTDSPSAFPSISPTLPPTASPTHYPTNNPSFSPSIFPTFSPSDAPTFSPSIAPSNAPTFSPSNVPSYSPSSAPTLPPSASPTRYPTENVDNIYDKFVEIQYSISHLTETNIYYIVDSQTQVMSDVTEIIEQNYVDAETLPFESFWLRIQTVNTKSIGDLTIYDLDVVFLQTAMILNCRIEADDIDSGLIIKESETETFRVGIETMLQAYLNNNTELQFNTTSISAAQDKFVDEQEDFTALYLSIIVVSLGCLTSFAALIYNKVSEFKKTDNAAFAVPFLISLQIYDFISDINLSVQIFKHEGMQFSINALIFWIGMASIFFVIMPLGSNLLYAVRINRQKEIQNNPAARAWFSKHLQQFILLCMLCAGCYPVLCLSSSRCFGLEFFDSGLMSMELHKLTRIKMKSTIYLENAPQLLVQIMFSIIIREFADATILAFVASSLSILASVLIYRAQKEQHQDMVTSTYYIVFGNEYRILDQEEMGKIKRNKGLKGHLAESMSRAFNISNRSIEVGFLTPTSYGCIVAVQQSIFEKSMDDLKQKLFSKTSLNQQFNISISPDLYIESLYKLHQTQIDEVFRVHFDLINPDFAAKYHKKYEEAIGSDADNDAVDIDDELLTLIKRQHTMAQSVVQTDVDEHTDDKENDGDGLEIEMEQLITKPSTSSKELDTKKVIQKMSKMEKQIKMYQDGTNNKMNQMMKMIAAIHQKMEIQSDNQNTSGE